MSDLDKAVAICRAYLSQRDKVRELLTRYTNDGVRAQSLEQDRSSGMTTVMDPGEDGGRPMVSDPTFNAAGRRDAFRQLLEDCEASERRLIGSANRLIGHTMLTLPQQIPQVLKAYRGSDDTFNRLIHHAAQTFAHALSHTVDANTTDVVGRAKPVPDCQSCVRLKLSDGPWRVDPDYLDGKPTDVAGHLDKPMKVCRACYKFISAEHRLPSVKELRLRYEDPRKHWPNEGRKGMVPA